MTKTSRKQLISWFNSLKIPITKIEDLGTGAPICNLLNIIHPTYRLVYTQSPSSKYEYLKNLKVAQGFFFETGVKLKFDIEKLVECKLQDNLEVAQWLYKYYVRNVGIRSDERNVNSVGSDGVKGGVSIEGGCNVGNVGMILNGRNVNCVGSDEKNNVDSVGSDERSMNRRNDGVSGNMDSSSINSVKNVDKNVKINECTMKSNKDINNKSTIREIYKDINTSSTNITHTSTTSFSTTNTSTTNNTTNKNKLIKDLQTQNTNLKTLLSQKDTLLQSLTNKLKLYEDNKVQDMIHEIEKNRDFYFLILVEIENYLGCSEEMSEGVKKDLYEILYRKE